MRETALRIRTFSKLENKFVDNPSIIYDSPKIIYSHDNHNLVITHYSGVNDSKGNLIYEGDVLKLSGKEDVEYGVVTMERTGLNDKEFYLTPAWTITEGVEYYILIDTPTIGDKRITGLFHNNDYPVNKQNGTGFSDGTISEVLGNVFQNEQLLSKLKK